MLALQILFHQARLGRKSACFVTIAEPAVSFLRHVQQFDFFDAQLMGNEVSILDLSSTAPTQGVTAAIQSAHEQIRAHAPEIVVIDSFKALRDEIHDSATLRHILYDLVVSLSVEGITAILVGEYDARDMVGLPEFLACDSIFRLSTANEGVRTTRNLEVLKLRGSQYLSGLHFFDISRAGISIYPLPARHRAAGGGARRRGSPGPALVDRGVGAGRDAGRGHPAWQHDADRGRHRHRQEPAGAQLPS